MLKKLSDEDIDFLLWCIGYIYIQSDNMEDKKRNFIKKHHNIILPKLMSLKLES